MGFAPAVDYRLSRRLSCEKGSDMSRIHPSRNPSRWDQHGEMQPAHPASAYTLRGCSMVCFHNALIPPPSPSLSPIPASLGHHRWLYNQFPPFFSVLHRPLGLGELQACQFSDVFSPLLLSALSSSPFHCALQDGFSRTWWTGDMSIPLQFASLYDGQVFVWSGCLLDLGTDFLVVNIVFVWDA